MCLKGFWSHTDDTLGIPFMHLRKQSKRELCSFDQKYKQKNKPVINVMLKLPCDTEKKLCTVYVVYVSVSSNQGREKSHKFHSFTLPACFFLAINSKK